MTLIWTASSLPCNHHLIHVIFLESWMHVQEMRGTPFLEDERKLQWMKAVLMLTCDPALSRTNSALQHDIPHPSHCRCWIVILCSIYIGIPVLTYQRPVVQNMCPQVSSFSNILNSLFFCDCGLIDAIDSLWVHCYLFYGICVRNFETKFWDCERTDYVSVKINKELITCR